MHIAVVANGDLPDQGREAVGQQLKTVDLVIAADGGITHCAQLDTWPDRLIGDLDSAPAELVDRARAHGTTIVEHPADKDATDLELALTDAMTVGATRITVVAPFGGRLDHELATIGLMASDQWSQVDVTATDGRRQLWVVRSSLDLVLPVQTTLSLVPWHGAVDGVTTEGLQWPLRDEPLPAGSTRGVSNVATEQHQRIAITGGTLLVITDWGQALGQDARSGH